MWVPSPCEQERRNILPTYPRSLFNKPDARYKGLG